MLMRGARKGRQVASSASFLLSQKHTPACPPTSRLSLALRYAHSVPPIRHESAFKESGVPDLFSKDGYELAWTAYQTHLLQKLDNILAGTARQNYPIHSIAMDTARNPSTAHTFNYASMAHNNHFFFNHIAPDHTDMPERLKHLLERSFSSIETLRETFLSTASAMFGPGFVWLVQQKDASPIVDRNELGLRVMNDTLEFRILTTYLAGSPYPGAHWRQQNRDMNTQNLESFADYERQTKVQNRVGAFGKQAEGMASISGGGLDDLKRFGGTDVVPLLCVSTWEHTWMPDWGIKGKNLFLEQWWERIDWEAVAQNVDWPINNGERRPNRLGSA